MSKSFIAGLLFLALLAGCAPNTAEQDQRLSAVEAQVSRISELEAQVSDLRAQIASSAPADDPVAALQARLAALEDMQQATQTSIAELESRAAEAQAEEAHGEDVHAGAFEVAVAQYVMDTAGFHGMDETLNETKTVDPGHLRTVNTVRKVLASAPWPEDLQEQAAGFLALLDEFGAALEADNGQEAARLATEAHNAQHDLSHAIDGWLGQGGDDHGG